MFKSIIALAVAAGFASASFAQAPATVPTAPPAASVSAPAPVTAEKKIEAPKAVDPVKAEATKAAAPAKMDAAQSETPKAAAKPAKAKKLGKKPVNTEPKAEAATPAVK